MNVGVDIDVEVFKFCSTNVGVSVNVGVGIVGVNVGTSVGMFVLAGAEVGITVGVEKQEESSAAIIKRRMIFFITRFDPGRSLQNHIQGESEMESGKIEVLPITSPSKLVATS